MGSAPEGGRHVPPSGGGAGALLLVEALVEEPADDRRAGAALDTGHEVETLNNVGRNSDPDELHVDLLDLAPWCRLHRHVKHATTFRATSGGWSRPLAPQHPAHPAKTGERETRPAP